MVLHPIDGKFVSSVTGVLRDILHMEWMTLEENKDKETAIVSVFADSSQRMLQDEAANLEFDLKVALQGISGDSSGSAPQSPGIVIQQRNGFPIIGIHFGIHDTTMWSSSTTTPEYSPIEST
jgi:hypothetical protein